MRDACNYILSFKFLGNNIVHNRYLGSPLGIVFARMVCQIWQQQWGSR